jgi:hypothetical protein
MKSNQTPERPIPADPDAALLPMEAALLLGLSPRTLEGFRFKGEGPPYFRIRRGIRYRRADIVAWIEARRVVPACGAEAVRDR